MKATIELGDCYLPLIEGAHRDRFILIEGPRGTGKTFAILCLLMAYALRHPGARILVVRSTRSRLSQSAMQTLETLVFPAFGMKVPGAAGAENRSSYRLTNGSEFILMGLDDMQRTQSVEVAKVYVVEAVEITNRHVVEALAGALRQAGMPDHQCLIDCNPGAPGHWLNHAAEPIRKGFRRCVTREDYERVQKHNRAPAKPGFWKRMLTRHQDNPAYWDYDDWGYTEAGRQYVDEVLSTMTGSLGVRWKEGEWVADEGSVFPNFDEERHVCPAFPIPTDWPMYLFYDPGFDHPTGISWLAVGPNGRYYVVDEIKESGKSAAQHFDRVLRTNEDKGYKVLRYFGDPHGAFRHDPGGAAPISAQLARSHGINLVPWPRSTKKEAMVNRYRERLDRRDSGGRPMLQVFETCRHAINEHQSWKFRRNDKGEQLKGDDLFEDADNDILDGLIGAADLNLQFDARPIKVVSSRRAE